MLEDNQDHITSQKNFKKPEQVQKSNSNLAIIFSTLAFICAGGSLVFSAINYQNRYQPNTNFQKDSNSANFTEGSISSVASKVSPSVVSITTETTKRGWYGPSISSAAGTGSIISSDGYILTNRHVVEGSNNISVILDNGTEYKNVELIGTDPLNDVAILKIKDAKDLPAVKLGDSKTITIGQQVIAIGNALGQYQNSVTEGIISGIGRSLVASDSTGSSRESLTDMIQTDASINQGNSGGPLVNAAGEVIGINTAVSASGNGLGFALPISSVKGIVTTVFNTGTFKRAYLGVYYTNLTPATAKANNLPVSAGAYVYREKGTAIIKGSAADKAGVKDKDIITAVNGVNIGTNGSLASLLGEYPVGDSLKLTVYRDGGYIELSITLEEYKDEA